LRRGDGQCKNLAPVSLEMVLNHVTFPVTSYKIFKIFIVDANHHDKL